MKLSELQQWLKGRGLRLTKSLGQNFLHDGNQLRRIVQAADLDQTDQVLEIGPGLGALTEHLLGKGVYLLAIEKDQRLAGCLRERLGTGFDLVNGDALDYVRDPRREWAGWKVVANLPYSVGSVILVELGLHASGPERMVLTLQMEVVERLAAEAGDAHYGLLSALMGLNYEVRGWFKIPASCFFPVPDVESACVTLRRREGPILRPGLDTEYVRIVKRGFSQRRKMLGKLLRQDWPEEAVTRGLDGADLGKEVRAEKVSVGQWAALTEAMVMWREQNR